MSNIERRHDGNGDTWYVEVDERGNEHTLWDYEPSVETVNAGIDGIVRADDPRLRFDPAFGYYLASD